MRNQYIENVCEMLRRKGLAEKYEHPGVYCIKLKDQIVYIGKSKNMLERVAAHYVGINTGSECKYRIIWEAAHQLDCAIEFDVLYYAQQTSKEDIVEEIEDLNIEETNKNTNKIIKNSPVGLFFCFQSTITYTGFSLTSTDTQPSSSAVRLLLTPSMSPYTASIRVAVSPSILN